MNTTLIITILAGACIMGDTVPLGNSGRVFNHNEQGFNSSWSLPDPFVCHKAGDGKSATASIGVSTNLSTCELSTKDHKFDLPPGQYTIEIEGQKIALDLTEGQQMEINVK